jgi:glycosyltransferase involved in cell wall biosynthesis
MATILFAPNLHTGGGRVLMEALDAASAGRIDKAIIDRRMRHVSPAFSRETTLLVRNRIGSRLHAEWQLWRSARAGDTVLCLHSLPPLLPLRARVVVLIQNRLLLERSPLTDFPWKTRLRIAIERLWSKHLQGHCNRYMVQTPAMASALGSLLRRPVPVVLVPFATQSTLDTAPPGSAAPRRFDFVYVASGEAHKNHRRLLQAWCLLAEAGLKPSLALTVDPQRYPALARAIENHASQQGLNIVNLGTLSAAEVERLYRSAGALVYPSLVESFGLPLIEAARHGLPLIAAELDYVRDVASPVQTFDAQSAVSMARALRRFLGQTEHPLQICSASQFLEEALR